MITDFLFLELFVQMLMLNYYVGFYLEILSDNLNFSLGEKLILAKE